MKIHKSNIALQVIILALSLLYGCEKKVRPPLAPQIFIGDPCALAVVQACIPNCEKVNHSENVAIQQVLASGKNLSPFGFVGCAGQFEIIFSCFLQRQGTNACQTLQTIIQNQTFGNVLEDPNCQCSSLYI